MAATKKSRRLQMLLFGGALLIGAAVLVSVAFRDAIVFFFSPTELLAAEHRPEQLIRVGGLVAEGSLVRGQGKTVTFDVTDGNGTVQVAFTGVLPDLFREGQGVIAEGRMRDGRFVASKVLAKHDENYMPKEVADALKEQGHFRGGE